MLFIFIPLYRAFSAEENDTKIIQFGWVNLILDAHFLKCGHLRFLPDFCNQQATNYVMNALHCNVSGDHVEPRILLFLLLTRINGLPSDTKMKGHS